MTRYACLGNAPEQTQLLGLRTGNELTFVLHAAAGALCKRGREAAAQPAGKGQGAGRPGTLSSSRSLSGAATCHMWAWHSCYCEAACLHCWQTIVNKSRRNRDWRLQVDQKGAEEKLDAEVEQLKV